MGRLWIALLLFVSLAVTPSAAEKRFIVRDTLGLSALTNTCFLLGCKVVGGLGDPFGSVFLVTTPDTTDSVAFLAKLLLQVGVTNAEVDALLSVNGAYAGAVPDALRDRAPVDYYGATVWNGYVNQPASTIVRRVETQATLGVSGAGIVAIIDTGLDPDHPAYRDRVVEGYDFTRNIAGGSEMGDVDQRTAAVVDQRTAAVVDGEEAYVNQRTVAVVDQRTAAVVDNPEYDAFGHGTMVAGIVHLIAPDAQIMPLKAFRADGSGYASDIVRAIYHAINKNAKTINMSFSFATRSVEVQRATEHATKKNVVCISSAGNDGQATLVYPAALSNVTGVASTTDLDAPSAFTNYGSTLVWVAAPGEGIVTTYPWGTYAAGWGTSFSTPFVSGGAALMVQVSNTLNQSKADTALTNAQWISEELNHGRLDLYRAIQAWRAALE